MLVFDSFLACGVYLLCSAVAKHRLQTYKFEMVEVLIRIAVKYANATIQQSNWLKFRSKFYTADSVSGLIKEKLA